MAQVVVGEVPYQWIEANQGLAVRRNDMDGRSDSGFNCSRTKIAFQMLGTLNLGTKTNLFPCHLFSQLFGFLIVTFVIKYAEDMAVSKLTAIIIITFLGGSIAETPEIETLPACGVNCLRDIFLRPQFVHQTQQQLCDNTEFIISIGTCLRENCNGTEKQAFLDAASKKCVIPAQDATVALRASSLVIFGSALGAYILRLISKCIYKSEWGADDTFMSLAAFLIIPLIVLLQLMVSEGIGRDLRTLKDEQIVFCFQKNPISLNWTGLYKPNHHGDVLNDKLLYLTHGIISMALDIWMVILPFTQVYHLGIKLRKKIGVLAMFSCGILLVGTSIIRFYYLVKYQVARDAEGKETSARAHP
ncbi:hypothetical protein FGSG_13972 [Fusarium graminearum PH-1]|uniref:Uncharacterized protein n=1 Tax=Gibberella zeae (strain ATCC MYA-4620 / CBS 123657 / FGSC 9075 / NRRL 31084 / PH-1) TaxID=229533 RepID=I1SAU1_GIBZE|nr:hypothetical protein FGSG_13972 [Fusarium graminearum PH-1]ESU18222.1 hypothetical protein FGSG_13972 [Fusarium graminearum PH-1]|eukprot:XP_011325844.1 hypothetical protein FGSG_13972 [Fusarium graminearum PH-1]